MRALGTRRRGLGQDSRGLLSAFTQGFPGHTLLTVTRPGSTEVSMAENRDITEIEGYHAHVYYDADTKEAARVLCEATRDRFGCNMGRMHDGPSARIRCGVANLPFRLNSLLRSFLG